MKWRAHRSRPPPPSNHPPVLGGSTCLSTWPSISPTPPPHSLMFPLPLGLPLAQPDLHRQSAQFLQPIAAKRIHLQDQDPAKLPPTFPNTLKQKHWEGSYDTQAYASTLYRLLEAFPRSQVSPPTSHSSIPLRCCFVHEHSGTRMVRHHHHTRQVLHQMGNCPKNGGSAYPPSPPRIPWRAKLSATYECNECEDKNGHESFRLPDPTAFLKSGTEALGTCQPEALRTLSWQKPGDNSHHRRRC
eukprot:TRINITY_DN999_c0_g1_i2.p1 TRINITY_DN999_c0_g1~~TRINITY_DN999_c0_g1_i2.p1  ORF type:complete len:243 (+),score=3.48 TRINITY_DN999_c0_g1_i2:1565-2293(+)